MFAYRYNHYLSPTQELPAIPFVSLTTALDLSRISMIPLDWAETMWNQQQSIVCVLHYDDSDVFYFIIPSHIDCSNTHDIRRFKLESSYDVNDHHCDYYAKPMIRRFIERLTLRLHTRSYLILVQSSIPFPPTELEYHQQFIQKIHMDQVDDLYEHSLIQSELQQSQEMVDNHREYSPGGKGMEEAQQDFEELALLTKRI